MKDEPLLVTVTEKPFYVYTNPSFAELLQIGPLVRFFANNGNKVVYAWDYYSGFHSQVSVGLNFLETFNSTDLLRGHAGNSNDGYYHMTGSDFLSTFVGKMTGKDRIFLNNLFNQNWDWVDEYIKVAGWINSCKERLGL